LRSDPTICHRVSFLGGETDADGHFAMHGLRFGYYGVIACMGQRWCIARNWQAKVALSPASRVKTVELRLLK
jgi:hypothetical protein